MLYRCDCRRRLVRQHRHRQPSCPATVRLLPLEVADNGVGFPADLDFHTASTLGLKLVAIFHGTGRAARSHRGTCHDVERRCRAHQGLSRRRDHRPVVCPLLCSAGCDRRPAEPAAAAGDRTGRRHGRGITRAQGRLALLGVCGADRAARQVGPSPWLRQSHARHHRAKTRRAAHGDSRRCLAPAGGVARFGPDPVHHHAHGRPQLCGRSGDPSEGSEGEPRLGLFHATNPELLAAVRDLQSQGRLSSGRSQPSRDANRTLRAPSQVDARVASRTGHGR